MLQEHSVCRLIRTTRYYLYFNFLQMVFSALVIAILVFSLPFSTVPLQLTIIVLLLIDILIRFFSDPNFIHKAYNKFDLLLVVLLTILVVMQLSGRAIYETLEEVGFLVLGIRYGLQLFRIVSLLKQSRELRLLQKMGDITLPELEGMEEIDGYHYQWQSKEKQ